MTDNSPIRHVSDTAFWIAEYRHLESQRKDALFKDPLAGKLAKAGGIHVTGLKGERRGMAWSVALRTKVIDDYILEGIQDDVDAVLNLGAGLDTRPYRLNLSPDLDWYEADFPPLIDFKAEMLKDDQPICSLHRRSLDVTRTSERKQLFQEINVAHNRVLVLTEGVIIYLPESEVASLAKALYEEEHFQYWIVDYFSPLLWKFMEKGQMFKRLRKNAPFQFKPDDWEGFFEGHRWPLKEMRYLADESQKAGRPLPTPWIFRIIGPFLPRSRTEDFRKMSGYALLARR